MLAAAARTTTSSLNDHRSSKEPPPRATIMRSGRGRAPRSDSSLKPRMALATSAAEVSPCTRTGHTNTRRGKRSSSRCRISRITAPVGEVTTPITLGKNGSSCLRSSSNRPSAVNFFLRSSRSFISAPIPAGSSVSMTIWYFEDPAKVVSLPDTMTSSPSSGFTRMRPYVPFQITPSKTALSSLSRK